MSDGAQELSTDRLVRSLRAIDTWPVPPGAAAAVIGPDGPLASHGETRLVSRIASVTKPLYAYAALIAVEDGTLRLDDPVGPVGSTVRHLLAHASGLGFTAADPSTVPGTRRIYSNAGFDLLGTHLADASGIEPAEYLAEAVFEPLGMTATSLQGSVARDVHSNVHDLAVFAQELLRPTLIAPETLREATTSQCGDLGGVVPDFGSHRPCPWGLGFEIRGAKAPHWTGTTNSRATFGHFGATGGFLWVDPVADRALVCLTGRDFGAWAKPLWPQLSDDVISASRAGG